MQQYANIYCPISTALLQMVSDANSCTYSWTASYATSGSYAMVEQTASPAYDLDTCQKACLSTLACLSVDFNNNSNSCWFGFGAVWTVPDDSVNHYVLTRITCGGAL